MSSVNTILTSAGLAAVTSAGVLGPYFAVKYFLPIYDVRIDESVHTSGATSAIPVSATETSGTPFTSVYGEKLFNTSGYTISTSTSFSFYDGVSISATGGSSFQISATGTSGSKQDSLFEVNLYNGLPISTSVSGALESSPSPGVFKFASGSSAIATAALPSFDINTSASRALVFPVFSYTPSVGSSGTSKGLFKCRLDELEGDFKFNKLVLFAVKTDASGVEDTSVGMVPLAYVGIANPIKKTTSGLNVTVVDIDVELGWSVAGASSIVYNNSEYWTRTGSSALGYTGSIGIGSSAYPGSWYTSGSKLRITNANEWAIEISKDTSEGVKVKGFSTSAEGWGAGDTRGLEFSRMQFRSGTGTSASGKFTIAIGDGSLAGNLTYAPSFINYALAFGYGTSAVGERSVSLGYQNYASGGNALAFGYQSRADGYTGDSAFTLAAGIQARTASGGLLAIGEIIGSGGSFVLTSATNDRAIAIGPGAGASGYNAMALQGYALARGDHSLAIGSGSLVGGMGGSNTPNISDGQYSIAIGRSTSARDDRSVAIGTSALAFNDDSIAIGSNAWSTNLYAISIGYFTSAAGNKSISVGNSTYATSTGSISMGVSSSALGTNSISIGTNTSAIAASSVSFGVTTIASAIRSTSFGIETIATGVDSTAIGNYTSAISSRALGLGYRANANSTDSIAIGYESAAQTSKAIAIGYRVSASGIGSFATGELTVVGGEYSFGIGTSAGGHSNYGYSSMSVGEVITIAAGSQYIFGIGSDVTVGNGNSESIIVGNCSTEDTSASFIIGRGVNNDSGTGTAGVSGTLIIGSNIDYSKQHLNTMLFGRNITATTSYTSASMIFGDGLTPGNALNSIIFGKNNVVSGGSSVSGTFALGESLNIGTKYNCVVIGKNINLSGSTIKESFVMGENLFTSGSYAFNFGYSNAQFKNGLISTLTNDDCTVTFGNNNISTSFTFTLGANNSVSALSASNSNESSFIIGTENACLGALRDPFGLYILGRGWDAADCYATTMIGHQSNATNGVLVEGSPISDGGRSMATVIGASRIAINENPYQNITGEMDSLMYFRPSVLYPSSSLFNISASYTSATTTSATSAFNPQGGIKIYITGIGYKWIPYGEIN